MLPLRLTRGVQNLHRLQRIAKVLTQHGFGHVVERLDLGRYVPLRFKAAKVGQDKVQTSKSIGERLTTVASELGPVFVKLGQMLADRPDIVPADILQALQALQDQVAPFDTESARRIIADELGGPVADLFAEVEEEPFASGSIGQVYRARLPGGRRVVIKVRRPDIEGTIRSDLDILRWLAEALESWMPEARPYRPAQVVEEFERMLLREMDYAHEAATTNRLCEAFHDDDAVTIPEVIWSHCSDNVLTLEMLEGAKVDEAIELYGDKLDRAKLAVTLTDVFFHQFFDIRTFHADPHQGNVLVKPPARVGLIDFGQIGVISDDTVGNILVLLLGALSRDMNVVAEALDEMGALSAEADRHQLISDLQMLVDKYHGQPIGRMRMGSMFAEAAEVARRHDATLPRDVVLMLKSLTTIWALALRLDPDMDLAAVLRPRLSAMIRSRLAPSRMFRSGALTLWHVLSLLRSGPQQLREVLRKASTGRWQIQVRHDNLEPLARDIDRSSNRLSFAVIISGVVIGSSMVVSSDPQVEVLGIRLQTLGVAGYLIAGVLGLGLLWAIFRSGRLS